MHKSSDLPPRVPYLDIEVSFRNENNEECKIFVSGIETLNPKNPGDQLISKVGSTFQREVKYLDVTGGDGNVYRIRSSKTTPLKQHGGIDQVYKSENLAGVNRATLLRVVKDVLEGKTEGTVSAVYSERGIPLNVKMEMIRANLEKKDDDYEQNRHFDPKYRMPPTFGYMEEDGEGKSSFLKTHPDFFQKHFPKEYAKYEKEHQKYNDYFKPRDVTHINPTRNPDGRVRDPDDPVDLIDSLFEDFNNWWTGNQSNQSKH